MIEFKDIKQGDVVRVNLPDNSEHGKLVTVEHVSPEAYQKVWARIPTGEMWWFMLYELEAVSEQQEGE
jgi:hypothetical protein